MSNPTQPSDASPQGDAEPSSTAINSKKVGFPQNTKQLVESGYDQIATTYLNWVNSKASPRLLYLEKLLAHLPQTLRPKVLELGCGAGFPVTQRLVTLADVTANDISSEQLALCAKHAPSTTRIHSDMMSLSFSAGSFDAVIAMYSIFHLPRDEQEELVEKMWGWLREGGWILVNFGSRENQASVIKFLDGIDMFYSGYGIEENRKMISRKGFEIVDTEVLVQIEDGKEVPFLWVLARKGSRGEEDV